MPSVSFAERVADGFGRVLAAQPTGDDPVVLGGRPVLKAQNNVFRKGGVRLHGHACFVGRYQDEAFRQFAFEVELALGIGSRRPPDRWDGALL